MPWTTTRLSSLRNIAMSPSPLFRCQLGGPVGRAVHRVRQRHQRVVGIVEDAPSLLDIVPVQSDHERLVGLVAEQFKGVHDTVAVSYTHLRAHETDSYL